MRALVAGLVALTLLLSAGPPHVHADPAAADDCAVCVLRHTAPPRAETPDVAPIVPFAGEVSGAARVAPVGGAPLGAVPGQSPPAGA